MRPLQVVANLYDNFKKEKFKTVHKKFDNLILKIEECPLNEEDKMKLFNDLFDKLKTKQP